ncbi:NACHT domain-containing protein [Streptomyces sp. NPDC059467]|uniref:NACHT domain-containing protein n=1 Tax=Streptomyces sp. NPDC059467 TaxID=3346844 RepID=UPI0036BB1F42
MPEAPPTPVKVEQALATAGHRLLLRGPAGSGKSTLLQWLALNSARQSFGAELADWNRCVPFVLRLRSFRTPRGCRCRRTSCPRRGCRWARPTAGSRGSW